MKVSSGSKNCETNLIISDNYKNKKVYIYPRELYWTILISLKKTVVPL